MAEHADTGDPHGGHPELGELRERVERGGAQRYHDAARATGKLFARERVALLVDEGSFTEDGRYANVLADGLPADGADSISFGDTTGMATPRRVRELVGGFRSQHPDVPLNLHFHNTRGTGLANVLAALELGVDDFDASVGGLGGCPYAPGATGNIATEELVHMVEDMGVATGVNLEAMIDAAAEAERIIGRQLPSQVLRAGPRTRTIPA